jgi:hypothetical protein
MISSYFLAMSSCWARAPDWSDFAVSSRSDSGVDRSVVVAGMHPGWAGGPSSTSESRVSTPAIARLSQVRPSVSLACLIGEPVGQNVDERERRLLPGFGSACGIGIPWSGRLQCDKYCGP